jgi:1,4-alpha-glucan branching enzyme
MRVEQEINKKASYIIHQLRNEQLLTNATRAKCITPGIELEKFKSLNKDESRKKLNFDSNVTNVLFVGRFVAEKGIKYALEALSKTKVPLSFRLIGAHGKSPSEHLLQQYPQFNYLGPKPMNELVEYMSASDIMVVPSLYEGFGLVAIEGMAAGCCMLVSAVGGLDELIENGVNGLKVPPGNTDAILEAFKKLAGNKTLQREMGVKNREIGLQNSWRRTAKRIRDVIGEITPKRRNTLWRTIVDILVYLQSFKINLLVQY